MTTDEWFCNECSVYFPVELDECPHCGAPVDHEVGVAMRKAVCHHSTTQIRKFKWAAAPGGPRTILVCQCWLTWHAHAPAAALASLEGWPD